MHWAQLSPAEGCGTPIMEQSFVASYHTWAGFSPSLHLPLAACRGPQRKGQLGATASATLWDKWEWKCSWQGALWSWGGERGSHPTLLHFLHYSPCNFQQADTPRSYVHTPSSTFFCSINIPQQPTLTLWPPPLTSLSTRLALWFRVLPL